MYNRKITKLYYKNDLYTIQFVTKQYQIDLDRHRSYALSIFCAGSKLLQWL